MITQTSTAQIAQWITDETPFTFVDVRNPWEHETASVQHAELLTQDRFDELKSLPTTTRLAFLCHHGMRSQQAAMHFASLGFTDVHNVVGGIDAWSMQVDSSVPRY
ncbi:MAG: monothiol glutaredoxin [Kiritimatiellia bacterium]|jgi:monothiol glutaredoxin